MNDLIDNLFKIQNEFFKSAVQETYDVLNLDKLIPQNNDLQTLAEMLELNRNALSRFLNAAASFNIIKKTQEGCYEVLAEKPHYNKDKSLVLFWMIKHKIPDLLNAKITSEDLIKIAGMDSEEKLKKAVLYKLIVFSQNEYGNFKVLEPYLLSQGENYIGNKMKHYEHVMYPMFSLKGLMGALKTGKSQWKEIFGIEAKTPFDIYKSQPELLNDFTMGLHYLNTADDVYFSQHLAGMFHFDMHTLLDLGGGSGAWAIALLKNSTSNFRIDIYELPEAIPLVSPIFFKHAPEETRVKYIPGSFFEDIDKNCLAGLPEEKKYDFINLGWILHDWNDEACVKILRKVYNHINQKGYILVFEALLPENKISQNSILDLAMLLQTEGCERTLNEYKKLLGLAGFKDVEHTETPTRRQLISARKD